MAHTLRECSLDPFQLQADCDSVTGIPPNGSSTSSTSTPPSSPPSLAPPNPPSEKPKRTSTEHMPIG